MTLYKVLGPNGESIHGGTGTWFLPKGKRPGKWMPKVEHVWVCSSGYHLVTITALPRWLILDCTIWEAEGRGAEDGDAQGKTAFAQARLLRRVYLSEKDMRLFAADCGEHVLPIFERTRPGDDRPRKAIEAARAFALGEIDQNAFDAAWDPAWDEEGAAAWAAAWDAERRWHAERLASYLTEEAT